jgi:uncharacterized protein YhfF
LENVKRSDAFKAFDPYVRPLNRQYPLFLIPKLSLFLHRSQIIANKLQTANCQLKTINMHYLVTIRTFDHTTDAYHYKDILRNHEIESYVEVLDYHEDEPLDAAELSHAKLSVLQGDVDDALQILRETDLEYFGSEKENTTDFNENGLVIVKKMSLSEEAYLYKARLQDEGLTCFIVNKHATNPLPLVGLTASTIELFVPKSQLHTAEMIIVEMDKVNMTEAPSSDNKVFLIGALFVLIALIFLVISFFAAQ